MLPTTTLQTGSPSVGVADSICEDWDWSILCLLTAADSFKHKEFFAKVGLAAKSADDIKKAFAVIDQDKSGFIEEDELK